jgi:hypothetical protein
MKIWNCYAIGTDREILSNFVFRLSQIFPYTSWIFQKKSHKMPTISQLSAKLVEILPKFVK